MKVTVYDYEFDSYENRNMLRIDIDGKTVFTISDGMEPEDARLTRDLSPCRDIASLLRRAHEAGKAGEDFVVENLASDPDAI